ncbi:UNVERIFIED_CONTAM: hypothetical protein RMT77_001726 [Armadillidium vulgare]
MMGLIKNKLVVSIEGNIGSGKSSILNTYKRDPAVLIYPEPVETWKNYNGTNMLANMYNDPAKYTFPFQLCNIITTDKIHNDIRENQSKKVRRNIAITERCPLTPVYVFISYSVEKGFLDETQQELLNTLNERINGDNLTPDMVIYVKTDPEVAFERIRNRNREEESTITLEFIQDLDIKHDEYMKVLKETYGVPVYMIDGNKSLQEIEKELSNLKPIMEKFLKTKIEREEEEKIIINSEKEEEDGEDDEIIKTCLPIPQPNRKETSIWNYIPFFDYIFSFIRYLIVSKNPKIELKKQA